MLMHKKNYKNIVAVTITIIFLFTLFSANASLELANTLFDNKDYDAAFVEYEKTAHIGSEPAQLKLAVMYMEGIGTKKNIVKSYVYLALAADNGNTQAKNFSAKIYNGFDYINQSKADKLWQEMSKRYTAEGLNNSASPQFKKKFKYERRAKQIGKTNRINSSTLANVSRTTIRSLSVTFDVGKDGKTRDVEIDRNFYMPITGIDASFAEVMNTVYRPAFLRGSKSKPINSYSYNKRWSTFASKMSVKERSPHFFTKLKKWERDAKKGDVDAQFNYAMVAIYFPFLKLDPTKKTVRSYMKNAAEGGVTDAQLEYSKMLQRGGRYFKKNLKVALKYLVYSAKAGNPRAQYKLGRQLLSSNVITMDETKAIYWLTKAANQQDVYAKYWLARILLTSKDTTQRNPVQAKVLLAEVQKSQEQNPNWYYYAAMAEYQLKNKKLSQSFISTAIDKAEELEWEVPEFATLANKVI